MTRRTMSGRVRVMAVAVALGLAVLPSCGGPSGGPVVTADFARGTGLYPGSPVRVIGIDIGRVTNVRNVDGRVRVRMQLASDAQVPANARATIVPLTLLGERYIQMGPAYRSGPKLRDGAHIPLERTSIPAEIDDLLRGLQSFSGAIDPARAGDVVTNLAQLLQDRGADINDLIGNAAGTLDLLADKGEDIKSIVASLRDLSATLAGRTESIETLIRNYELVSQILIDNRQDLDGVITQLDRATVELAELLAVHEDPLREDVQVLATTGGLVAANTDNIELTLRSAVKLFEAAGRAYESRTNSLRVNNQTSPELTSDLVAGRLRDRIAGLCRRLGIPACSDPASPLLNEVSGLLPGILGGLGDAQESDPPAPPSTAPPSPPTVPVPPVPSAPELLAALADQITDGLDDAQRELLESLDQERLAALLGLDPVLLQALPELDEDQIDRLRTADPDDIDDVMLALYNEVFPPADRLEPLLPPVTVPPTPTVPPLPGGSGGGSAPTLPGIPGLGD